MPEAVVVGGGLNALGVARSLAREGVAVRLLAGGRDLPAARSRHVRLSCYDDRQPENVIDALLDIARQTPGLRRPLILTEEEKVTAVSADRERLINDYILQLPAAETVTQLLHKDGFRAAAEAGGHVLPRTRRIRAVADLAGLADLVPPLVIKPAGRQKAFLARFPRATRVDTLAAARDALRAMLTVSDDLVVQEWIEGDDSTIYFCLQYVPADDRAPISFVGRKLRAWPRQTGGTARCVAAPEAADVLEPTTTRFCRQHGVVGLAGMEYKWRASTQEYVMIEPTIGRTDHQEEIATLNGTNLVWTAYRLALGLDAPAVKSVSPPRIWKDPMADANAAAVDKRIACPPPRDARVVDALWRPNDPGPSLLDLRDRARVRLQRMMGRVTP